MSEDILPEFLDPVLDYLSSVLPPQLYSLVTNVLAYSFSLLSSVIDVLKTLARTPPSSWDAETILPPIITLLMAYLALLSFYRTTGWMVRTTFAFVKWGFFLTTLGALAGYFIANSNPVDGNGTSGVGQFGTSLVSSLGGMLLGLLGQGAQDTGTRRRTRTQSARQRNQEQPRPKAWESWDRHHEWKYTEEAEKMDDVQDADVREVVGKVLRSAGNAIKDSGLWDTAKGVVDEVTKGLHGDGQRSAGQGESKRKQSTNEKKQKEKNTHLRY